jgi:prevent-host-death family protein
MKKWQLQAAKNKFSQVAEEAAVYGPQIVTKHGQDAVVILGIEEYRRLTRKEKTLAEFLLNSPLSGTQLEITRETSGGREINL